MAAFRRDHRLAHERIGDNTLVSELQSVIERSVCPVHRARQIRGILENPSAELRELTGEPEHLGPVRPPDHLARPFDNRHLKTNRTGNADRSHQPIRLDVAAMDLAERRKYRDSTG